MVETDRAPDHSQDDLHPAAKPARRALGKGLESLLPATPRHIQVGHSQIGHQPAAGTQADGAPGQEPAAARHTDPASPYHVLPLSLIDRNPYQTRRHINQESLAELAKSIAQNGLLHPINVRPVADGRFQIVGGERRFLAVQQLGHDAIAAIVQPAADDEAMVRTIVENLQRDDLNPMEQARAFERLMRQFYFHHDDISARTGKDRSTVTNYTRLLKLPDELQKAVEEGKLTTGHGKAIASLGDHEAMTAVGFKVMTQELSVRKTEELVNFVLHGKPKKLEKPAPPVDPNVRDAQGQLQHALGLKVTIEDRNGKGKVIIEYSNLDDFEVLMNSFGQRKASS